MIDILSCHNNANKQASFLKINAGVVDKMSSSKWTDQLCQTSVPKCVYQSFILRVTDWWQMQPLWFLLHVLSQDSRVLRACILEQVTSSTPNWEQKSSSVLTAEALVTEDSTLSLLNLCTESLDSLFPNYSSSCKCWPIRRVTPDYGCWEILSLLM